jgi:hypothetical protein
MLLAIISPAIEKLSSSAPENGVKPIVNSLTKIKDIWVPHIHLEEQYFSSEVLGSVMVLEEQRRIGEATGKYSQEHSSPPYWIIPFILFNLENEDRNTMTALFPPAIMEEMIPKVWKEQWEPMKPFLLD